MTPIMVRRPVKFPATNPPHQGDTMTNNVEELAEILASVQRAYLTDRDQYGGRSLPVAQAEAVLATISHPPDRTASPLPPLPDPSRRAALLQILLETAPVRPGSWAQLVAGACRHPGLPGYPPPTEAEYAAMGACTLDQLLTPEPAGQARVVWPYCPHPHASGQPERLHRVASGWLCGGHTPHGHPCGYEITPGGEDPALTACLP